MRLIFGLFFWFIYLPLLRLANLLLFWNKKLEDRERFEKKNKFEYLAQTFKDKKIKADICFEFSSEGEYQQVAPLIDDALKKGMILELVFFSPSVEKTIMKLAAQYSEQIRYLRYPIVRFFPFIERRSFTHWVTADTLVMVRYDLFPEFLLWGMHPKRKLKLVWFSFIKERNAGKAISWWKKQFMKAAETVVFATQDDQMLAESLGIKGSTFDFRMEQIHRRVQVRADKFKQSFPLYKDLSALYQNIPREKRLIIGNAWPNDLFLISQLPKDVFVLIVPHNLSPEVMHQFRIALQDLGRSFVEVDQNSSSIPDGQIVLLNKKGVLCELYADFGKSYVGGGFNGSIHSVLEPLVAGSEMIACGPEHHRSTEFEVAIEQGRMTEVSTPEMLLEWLNSHPEIQADAKIEELLKNYPLNRDQVLSC